MVNDFELEKIKEVKEKMRISQKRLDELNFKGSKLTVAENKEKRYLKRQISIYLGILTQYQNLEFATEEVRNQIVTSNNSQKVLTRKPIFVRTNLGKKRR